MKWTILTKNWIQIYNFVWNGREALKYPCQMNQIRKQIFRIIMMPQNLRTRIFQCNWFKTDFKVFKYSQKMGTAKIRFFIFSRYFFIISKKFLNSTSLDCQKIYKKIWFIYLFSGILCDLPNSRFLMCFPFCDMKFETDVLMIEFININSTLYFIILTIYRFQRTRKIILKIIIFTYQLLYYLKFSTYFY